MENKNVKWVSYAEEVDMGGFPVRQPFPTAKVDMIDPFLLLHHARVKVPKSRMPKDAGIGPHPHRGFAPVTFVFEGGVHHQDSRGNNSTIYAGGTQWMEAGMGIIHSERPPDDIHEIGGYQEIIQLWINTPQASKMDQPRYFGLTKEDTPMIRDSDIEKIWLVSGEYGNLKGPVPTKSDVVSIRAEFAEGGTFSFQVPETHNAYLYALDGKLNISGYGLLEGLRLAQFDPGPGQIEIKALANTRFILMSGEPLHEPVAKHGPFVMNSQTEIMEAMRDYQMGKMGFLVEE